MADRLDACAVVVGALDSPYLPHTLSALATQTQPAYRIVLALLDDDQAPREHTAGARELLAGAGLGPDRPGSLAPGGVQVVAAGAASGFGAAVNAALAGLSTAGDARGSDAPGSRAPGSDAGGSDAGGSDAPGGDAPGSDAPGRSARDTPGRAHPAPWLWLLHDDSAPDPRALERLLDAVDSASSVAVAGAKQVDWDNPDTLISVGVALTVDGQRYTGIEDGEIDQGQHDGREDVYAVGTAGMVIRTQMWHRLGGPDPALGVFGDGADLCRRVRLAGQRVIVVPGARVRHARAGWRGLRTRTGARTREPVAADPRRTFGAVRTAQVHSWLVRSPLLLVPLVALAALLLGPVRALWRVAANELALASAELRAVALALLRPGAVLRARRRAARTRRVAARHLVPLQATWGQIWRARRNRRLQAAAERRAAAAPSELEMAERAAVARRRRLAFGVVALVTTLVAMVTLGPLLAAGPLIGGGLLPADVSFAQLWQTALGSWVGTGDGYPGPPDPLWFVLAVISALTGGWAGTPVQVSLTLLLVLAMPLAAISAWFAAGAASRSVLVRTWAAGIWAFGPPLLLALGQGRVGAVLAHLALPLVALGIARSLGADRRDVVISGMVGAQRVGRRSAAAEPRSAREAKRARLAALAAVGKQDPQDREELFADLEPIRSNTAARDEPSEQADAEHQERATVVSRPSRAPSIAAAAAAGLAFAVAAAGAPVLLPAGLLLVAVLAAALGRRRRLVAGRARLILVALPAVVLLGPIWTEAIRTWTQGGWRLLLADPGVPLAADAGPAWLTLLAWPAAPAIGPGPVLIGTGTQILPLAATAALVLGALLALHRGGRRSRAVRIGWLISATGLATALISSRTVVGLGRARDGIEGADELVTGWAGAGTSVLLLGFLIATVVALDGLHHALSGRAFGWRQISAAGAIVLLVAGLVISAGTWGATVVGQRSTDTPQDPADQAAVLLGARGPDPVPALGRTVQGPEQGARVLALSATPEGIDAQIWRHNGPQLTETATVVSLGRAMAHSGQGALFADQADEHLMALVADLAAGSAGSAAGRLATHAVAVVLVPPVDSAATGVARVDEAGRSRLIAHLDAVAGLERVTENPAGVIWRVSAGPGSTDTTIARGQVRGQDGGLITNLTFEHNTGTARLGPEGSGRTVVLAERSAPAWRAELDGRALRAVGDSWQQTFSIPDDAAGELTVHYRPGLHTPWQVLTAVVLGLSVLLALPTRRRREGA